MKTGYYTRDIGFSQYLSKKYSNSEILSSFIFNYFKRKVKIKEKFSFVRSVFIDRLVLINADKKSPSLQRSFLNLCQKDFI
jgi:hypothetical protein